MKIVANIEVLFELKMNHSFSYENKYVFQIELKLYVSKMKEYQNDYL